MIGTFVVTDGLYKPVVSSNSRAHSIEEKNTVVTHSCNKLPIELWHFCLGHVFHDRLQLMKQHYSYLFSDKSFVCDACHHPKQRKLPFPKSESHASQSFALLHVDILGPCATTFMHGRNFFLTIVDDHTRFVWIILMSSKAETQTHNRLCHLCRKSF